MHPADEAWIRWYAAFTDSDEATARAVLLELEAMRRRHDETGDPFRGGPTVGAPRDG